MEKPVARIFGLMFLALCAGGVLPLTASGRDSTLLDSGWRFQQGDPAGAERIDFNDAGWEPISIPHCWGWEEAQRGEKPLRGPGWYRRDLDIGPPAEGKRYFLRFEAAGSVADVYLNGKQLGEHRGAFGAFCFEITGELSASGKNVLAVRVSNAEEPDVAPLSGDFPVYGGLYRPAHLVEAGEENFTLTDHASPGVAWLQTSVSEKQALLDVNVEISNGTKKKQAFTLVVRVLDADGKEAGRTEQEITSQASLTEPFHLQLALDNPHLWNGRKDPYLYRAVVELRSAGDVVDAVEQPLGLRFYSIDPEKGFFLNGQPYQLRGVNRHQDWPDKGWAISEANMDEDMALLKEIGATVIRCCHYQHSDYFYSQCDKAGILVWAEIPQVNIIRNNLAFQTTSAEQLRDLIRQNINHPSIFVWSLFNEVGNGGTEDPHRELEDLKIIANGEDPTRPTAGAASVAGLPQMNKIPDVLGWNFYPGWYTAWGMLTDHNALDKYRSTSRHGGFAVTEYGAGANVTQHEESPKQPKPNGQWHPEEWQATVHEAAWRQFHSHPYIWGIFVWDLDDFTSYWRHEGGALGRNDKGLVTSDRKTKKDAFYFYKANWSDDPVLYITDRRFVDRKNATTNVKIYSNAAAAELSINGVSQGVRNNDGNDVFVWNSVQLSPGDNKIEATAQRNGQKLSDQCVWTLKP